MQIRIYHLIGFTALIGMQIRFFQLRVLGVTISLLICVSCFFLIFASAFASQSKNGMLAVDENPAFKTWKYLFAVSFANLLIVGLLVFLVESNIIPWNDWASQY